MENTAKNFSLQLGSLISLYVTIGALVALLLGIITILYPDVDQYAWEYESAASTVRTTIAVLVFFFPTYIFLTRLVNTIRRIEHGVYLVLTKWLIYLSLVVGCIVLLSDLVTILISFLNGELTIRFILKAVSVFFVVGTAVAYYGADVRGYWQAHERESIYYAICVSSIIIITIVWGFTKIETPQEIREIHVDEAQIYDLQHIQDRIEAYFILTKKLPHSLEDAFGTLSIPQAAEGRVDYSYTVTREDSFTICAEFMFPTNTLGGKTLAIYSQEPYIEPARIKNRDDWEHTAGVWCFERLLSQENIVK